MPTYEYECNACGHKFDEFQYYSEEPLTKCPECKKKKLRRLFGTGSSVIFKGSGFYETDYRSESYQAGAKAEQDAQKPASESESAKGESSNGTPAKDAAKSETSAGKGSTKSKAGKGSKGNSADRGASGK